MYTSFISLVVPISYPKFTLPISWHELLISFAQQVNTFKKIEMYIQIY